MSKLNSLIAYFATRPLALTQERLSEALAECPARDCGKTEPTTHGFGPVQTGSDELALPIAGGFMIRAYKQERILPASVLREAVDKKVAEIEAEQGRPVYKKERDSIKDEMLLDMLPKAFTRSHSCLAWVSRDRVLVFAASFRKAEELTSQLRSVLGSLPIIAPLLKNAPSAKMTAWIDPHEDDLHSQFSLGDKAKLRDTAEEGGTVTFAREQLTSHEVRVNLDTGKQVSEIQLEWNDATLTFTVNESLLIKSIKVSDDLKEEAEAQAGDGCDLADQHATWLLTINAFNSMLTDLFDALGGLDTENMSTGTSTQVEA